MTRILAVDDSSTIRQCLAITFAGTEYELVLCNGPIEALAAVIQAPPALVLADATLTPTDGYALCAQLKENSPGVPVVVMTSKQRPFDAVRGAEAADHIDKPFDTQKLRDMVRDVIDAAAQVKVPAAAEASASVDDGWAVAGQAQAQAEGSDREALGGESDQAPPELSTMPFSGAPDDGLPVAGAPRQAGARQQTGMPAARLPADTMAGIPQEPAVPQDAPLAVDETPRFEGSSASESATESVSAGPPTPRSFAVDDPAEDLDDLDQPSYSSMPAPAGDYPSELPEPPSEPEPDTEIGSSLPPPPAFDDESPDGTSGRSQSSGSPISDPAGDALGELGEPIVSSWPSPNDELTFASPVPRAAAVATDDLGALKSHLQSTGLQQEQIEAVLKLSREVIERVVWEVVPTLAERLIQEEIERLIKE
ncbi:MAG: response regulator [Polyangiaceae bacterium]